MKIKADFTYLISVADPGCLSRIPDPDFYPSKIQDPKTATKERGEKKFVVITFYVATNLKFWSAEKKNLGQFSKNYRTFTPKIVTKLSKIWIWDPGSGFRKKPIPDLGSRGQKGPGSRIPDPDPQHCIFYCKVMHCEPLDLDSGSKWSGSKVFGNARSGNGSIIHGYAALSSNIRIAQEDLYNVHITGCLMFLRATLINITFSCWLYLLLLIFFVGRHIPVPTYFHRGYSSFPCVQ